MKCPTCGEEHKLLDPIFRRPDAVVTLSEAERKSRVKENDDLCVIRAQDAEPADRYFVRCLLPVRLLDATSGINWGIWAEVAEADFRRIWGSGTIPGRWRSHRCRQPTNPSPDP
jgi:hypothetical protein